MAASQYCYFEMEEKKVHGNSQSIQKSENTDWLNKEETLMLLIMKDTCDGGSFQTNVSYNLYLIKGRFFVNDEFWFVSHDGPNVSKRAPF